MSKLSLWKTIGFVCAFCAAAVIDSPAQTFTSLASLYGWPYGSLVQGLDGNFYGTTTWWGGTVFRITPAGSVTTLSGVGDGFWPWAGLVLATDGNFYGTTSGGGPDGDGIVFKITAGGKFTWLRSFHGSDGANPVGPLIQATDGNFYGTTEYGGAFDAGTVFKINPGGTLTSLQSFLSGGPKAGLVQATDGNFYGTTYYGGTSAGGQIFEMTAEGTLASLYNFCPKLPCTDGFAPSGLVLATDGNFYGTTQYGGTNGSGTVFKMTPGGTLTTLHSFDGTDGAQPTAGLVQATDGNFYGTTYGGGTYNEGTVFKITPAGELTTLHSFDGTDGDSPAAALVQGTNGTFYGTTVNGGASGIGTVFSLAVGLGPFVETLPTFGEVGATVKILGTDLTGATSVTFDGIAAAFTVVSSSEITTTVPRGAATGKVEVTTPQGTLISNVDFRVTPSVISATPAAATGPNVTFALAYSAAPGKAYTDLEWARVLFTGQTGVNVCRVDYYQPCEEFYLESDTGT
jgi:uncharacterized repeat protein (TIGR03803 family)